MKNKKGYYAALFSFLCIVAVFAGVNMVREDGKSDKAEQRKNAQVEMQESSRVDANKNAPAVLPQVKVEAETQEPVAQAPKAEENEFAQDDKEGTSGTEVAQADAQVSFNEAVDTQETAAFDNDLKLAWPVAGDIVMDYSADVAIYDQTLDQYRTNDSVCISAKEGTPVKAAGDGVVELVAQDSKNGKTVVINHNNGWKTTYSQLDENVQVSQGDSVKKGQEIGSVGSPTKYSVALGSHLDFQVTRDDQSIDPKIALAE